MTSISPLIVANSSENRDSDKFNNGGTFSKATFNEDADFTGATFNGYTYFNDSKFNKGADFSRITFSRAAYFNGVTFSGSTYFSNPIDVMPETLGSNKTFDENLKELQRLTVEEYKTITFDRYWSLIAMKKHENV